jgi:hypothetical protein
MLRLFSEAKLKPIIAGTLKRVPLMKQVLPKKTGGSINARYCYSVWLRHLSYLALYNGNRVPARVAELGPGDSLGVGLAALLSGSEKYYALDVIKFWQPARNIQIFNDLLILFNSRANIPDNFEFPNIFPVLDDYSFPSNILTEEMLMLSLNPARIEKIISELNNPDDSNNTIIKFKIPWFERKVINERSLDLILSQAVMGQVDELENTYFSMNSWLIESGFISHSIDFRSTGFTRSWNGHWTLSEFEWKVVRGGRVYAINRQPISTHRALLKRYNFPILYEKTITSNNGFKKADLARQFQNITEEDLITSGIFFVAQKA